MNENDEADEDAIDMSVEELQMLTDDNLNGSLQVRHKVHRNTSYGMHNLLYWVPFM